MWAVSCLVPKYSYFCPRKHKIPLSILLSVSLDGLWSSLPSVALVPGLHPSFVTCNTKVVFCSKCWRPGSGDTLYIVIVEPQQKQILIIQKGEYSCVGPQQKQILISQMYLVSHSALYEVLNLIRYMTGTALFLKLMWTTHSIILGECGWFTYCNQGCVINLLLQKNLTSCSLTCCPWKAGFLIHFTSTGSAVFVKLI